jgi:hypothetical protein
VVTSCKRQSCRYGFAGLMINEIGDGRTGPGIGGLKVFV